MSESGNLSLLGYGAIIWRYKVLVALVVIGMAGAAAGVSSLQQPTYLASAEIVLAQQQLDSNYNLEVQELSARQMDTQIAVIKSDAVADRARRKGVVVPVAATSTAESNLVLVSVVDSDPQRAADAANAYVDAYREITAEGVSKTLDDAETQLKNRLSLLQGQIDPLVQQLRVSSGADRANAQASIGGLLSGLQQQQAGLQAQLGRIEVQRALSESSTVVQRATPPDTPVGPKPVQDGALAAVLGLLIGCSVSVLLHLRRTRSARAAERVEPAPSAPGRGDGDWGVNTAALRHSPVQQDLQAGLDRSDPFGHQGPPTRPPVPLGQPGSPAERTVGLAARTPAAPESWPSPRPTPNGPNGRRG